MKLTRKQLKMLVENYLYEQSAISDLEEPTDEDLPEEEPADEEMESAEPPEEESAEPPEEEAPEETPEVDVNSSKSFQLKNNQGEISNVQFFSRKDSEGKEKVFVKVNGEELKNADKMTMYGLSGTGMQGVKDEVTLKVLSKISQAMDVSLKKFGDDDKKIKDMIGKKIAGSRQPFDNITKLIDKAKG